MINRNEQGVFIGLVTVMGHVYRISRGEEGLCIGSVIMKKAGVKDQS